MRDPIDRVLDGLQELHRDLLDTKRLLLAAILCLTDQNLPRLADEGLDNAEDFEFLVRRDLENRQKAAQESRDGSV
jgi:hypothetical protein